MRSGICEECGAPFERNARGRPRRFCGTCSSPAAAARRWKAENPDRRDAYNASRRAVRVAKTCVVCGELFTPKRSDCQVCSDICRWARDRARAA
jgi:hypothetical protein